MGRSRGREEQGWGQARSTLQGLRLRESGVECGMWTRLLRELPYSLASEASNGVTNWPHVTSTQLCQLLLTPAACWHL